MSNPRVIKKSNVSIEGPGRRLQNLEMWNSTYIADYDHVNISSFAVLDITLWLEEDENFLHIRNQQ